METKLISYHSAMKPILITLLICTALACKSAREIRTAVVSGDSTARAQSGLLKQYAFCECLRQAYKTNEHMKDDVSLSVYYDQLLYDEKAIEMIDSLTKTVADSIKPYDNIDYRGKKPVIYKCMMYYTSRTLDSMVNSLEKNIMK